MAEQNTASHDRFPVTISDWRTLQENATEPTHLLTLLARAQSNTSNAWISIATTEQIVSQWKHITALRSQGTDLPLFGVPFAVKDNIDVAGFYTTAACPSFATEPATADATVVARLKKQGAIVLGKTNLDQFATGLVGTRSPYGAVTNAFDPTRVSGGSSSGSGVVVSQGLVPFALGTDTAGSGRVPAGLNNVIGLKPTRGALSTEGVLPACRSLDCVSIFALIVEDAKLVLRLAEGHDPADAYSRDRSDTATRKIPRGIPPSQPVLAICAKPEWFGGKHHETAYTNSLTKAQRLGWRLEPVDFTPLFTLASLLYEGPWVAERYAAIDNFIRSAPAEAMDPVVRGIIMKAENFNAVDVFKQEYRRQELSREAERIFKKFDGILVPTTLTFPTMLEMKKEPVVENSQLGTYTNFVNFLDWTAIAIPAGWRGDGLPFGITLIAGPWEESRLLDLSRRWLSDASRRLGATEVLYQETEITSSVDSGSMEVAVVGAHLSGFPLNKDLVQRDATFITATTTAACYELYALHTGSPVSKPGLKRVQKGGSSIELEVWNMPRSQMGSFLETIVTPLGIGSIELKDGRWVRGFICEPDGLDNATDITGYGGWRAYTRSLHTPTSSLSSALGTPASSIGENRIQRILIANRGEIAFRIIRTLRDMNISSVAIYSNAEVCSPHVTSADIALPLSGNTVAETYLNGSQILELARQTDADAVIPGYGFLAENADFAAAVQDAGLIWIGPTPEQMHELGLKHRAREIAIAAGVPVVPGSKGLVSGLEMALEEAEKVGYPVMVKSTAGGGGIGLQRCDDEDALREAFDGVRRLGQANFGDDGVFIEHFIEHARHIEVQVLGDGTGRVQCAGERDCSLQRRNQKVVEETPAVFVPLEIRQEMRRAATALASSVYYRNVGTVEFIFDIDTEQFYFLEMNTRLQVEHPVTEEGTGLDLVSCMVSIAMDNCTSIFTSPTSETPVTGAAIEARVYAESPLQDFRPSPGKLLDVSFPSDVRVDTWVKAGQELSSSYDPLIAKIIAHGPDRSSAIKKMLDALSKTVITGVETNISYLQQIMSSNIFRSGTFTTKSLDTFPYEAPVMEVIDAGSQTSVQDFPGRQGLWHIGLPPSGPMDSYSFRLANRLIGNDPDAAGLECSIEGLTLLFHCASTVAVVGADAPVCVDGKEFPGGRVFHLQPGQMLAIGTATNGARTYLAVRGGVQVPVAMGSRSTFATGHLGGHNGRNLRIGDLLKITPCTPCDDLITYQSPAIPLPTHASRLWTVAVVPGPHGSPTHFTQDGLMKLFAGTWTVHYNSNRLGVRLTGPRPEWARVSGGDAGLHPSNIHDSPYSIGSVSFTGDEAVVLTADGPTLGGFVVFATVVEAEMWKFGQMRPGDCLRLKPVPLEVARALADDIEHSIENLTPLNNQLKTNGETLDVQSPIVKVIREAGRFIVCRQAGDRALLLDFGDKDNFTLRQTFHILNFIEQHRINPIPDVQELTPGVRSLHLRLEAHCPLQRVTEAIAAHEKSLGTQLRSRLPSRVVSMPLVFDDDKSRKAIARYTSTIRSSAPYLPSNIDFLQQLNGMETRDQVSQNLYSATFLILGLGDVYQGSPCAVPLDPRHRLFGTKYNPSRSFTPRGAVGIAGQYLCIYATDSPGGYQLVGRTVPIWDEYHKANLAQGAARNPWLFTLLDQINFYPLAEKDLVLAEEKHTAHDLIKITETELDLDKYEKWLRENAEDIDAVREQRSKAVHQAEFFDDLLKPYEPSSTIPASPRDNSQGISGDRVKAQLPGRCFRCAVKEGEDVKVGDALIWIESNKMEVKICAPIDGKCVRLLVEQGDIIGPADDVVIIQ